MLTSLDLFQAIPIAPTLGVAYPLLPPANYALAILNPTISHSLLISLPLPRKLSSLPAHSHTWLILTNYLNLLLDITSSKKPSLISLVLDVSAMYNCHTLFLPSAESTHLPLLLGCKLCESKDCAHPIDTQYLCP